VIWCHVINALMYSSVLSRLKKLADADRDVSRRSGGRLFQVAGPETAKPRGPQRAKRVRGTTRSQWTAERRWVRPDVADTGPWGACPTVWKLKISDNIAYLASAVPNGREMNYICLLFFSREDTNHFSVTRSDLSEFDSRILKVKGHLVERIPPPRRNSPLYNYYWTNAR